MLDINLDDQTNNHNTTQALPDKVSYAEFKVLIQDQAALFKRQDGRFYVMVSLLEAEHLRSVMHLRQGTDLTGKSVVSRESARFENVKDVSATETKAVMWSLSDLDAFKLATSGSNPVPSPKSQHKAMVNAYRFLNSDMYFDDTSLMALLRILSSNTCEQREAWWNDVRTCRRRSQAPVDGSMPVSTLFTTLDEYQFLEFRSIVERMTMVMQERGMFVFDAFRVFNSSHSGLITCSELYGALEWMNLKFTPAQVYDFVKRVAVDNEGLISYVDFKRVFRIAEDEIESRNITSHSFGSVVPKPIPEIADLTKKVFVCYHDIYVYLFLFLLTFFY